MVKAFLFLTNDKFIIKIRLPFIISISDAYSPNIILLNGITQCQVKPEYLF